MYDNHIFCREYKEFKDTIADIFNGDDTETDLEEFQCQIQQLYEDGLMPATQYDDLMRYLQDML